MTLAAHVGLWLRSADLSSQAAHVVVLWLRDQLICQVSSLMMECWLNTIHISFLMPEVKCPIYSSYLPFIIRTGELNLGCRGGGGGYFSFLKEFKETVSRGFIPQFWFNKLSHQGFWLACWSIFKYDSDFKEIFESNTAVSLTERSKEFGPR